MTRVSRSAVGLVVAMMLVACGGGVDHRGAALTNLQDVLGVSEDVADCIIEEFGPDRLDEIDDFDPEASDAASEAIDDAAEAVATCMIDDLTTDEDPGVAAVDCTTIEVDGPCDYGDDADFDVMWDSCDAGDMAACDDLYFAAPAGSRYEQFGNTCGDRGFALTCLESTE